MTALKETFGRLRNERWDNLSGGLRAAEIKGALEKLAAGDPEVRRAAMATLQSTIFHQGSVFHVSVRAVPYLLELLEAPEVQGKDQILRLLTFMIAQEPWTYLSDGAFDDLSDVEYEDRAAMSPSPEMPFIWIMAPIRDGTPLYCALLDVADTATRSAAAMLLGFAGWPTEVARAALWKRVGADACDGVRATALISWGMLGVSPSGPLQQDVERLRGVCGEGGLVAWAANVALFYLQKGEVDDATVVAIETGATMESASPQIFPWQDGDIRRVTERVLGR